MVLMIDVQSRNNGVPQVAVSITRDAIDEQRAETHRNLIESWLSLHNFDMTPRDELGRKPVYISLHVEETWRIHYIATSDHERLRAERVLRQLYTLYLGNVRP